jgi:hypothetical protein
MHRSQRVIVGSRLASIFDSIVIIYQSLLVDLLYPLRLAQASVHPAAGCRLAQHILYE